ncbi:MAG: diguanylate cyclase [Deltaproteobacteria bacterium]|nr:diguanylate cyclase [Deltaproteobacteria bacterium]
MYNVLVIDDSQLLRSNLVRILSDTGLLHQVYEAQDGEEGLRYLRTQKIDLVLTDLAMPKANGFVFLESKEKDPKIRNIPVIIITGSVEIETKVLGFESGAVDYITKPFEPAELIGRVKAQLKIKSLQDELREANQRLEILSTIDELTQVYNRRHFIALFDKELKRAQRYLLPLCCIMGDIDYFKKVNDQYGHIAGDQVLVSITQTLKSTLREVDILGRYGGEEMIFLLPETDLKQGLEVAERIRQSVEATSVPIRPDKEVKITLSLGVAAFPNAEIKGIDDFIRRADEALYRAKEKGRNRVES